MKLFRKLREQFIVKLAYINYFKYAIGEIVLVVIGILIALQINNWNEIRKQEIVIQNYYVKISNEIDSLLELLENNTSYTEYMTKELKYCIDYMESKRIDSNAVYIEKLKLTTDCASQTFFYPVINEFLSQGYLTKVNDKKISKYFENLSYYQQQINVNDEDRTNYCVMQLQPFIQKNINYSDIMLDSGVNPHFDLPDVSTKNGPKTDFQKMQNSIELWNLIYRKIEIERDALVINKSLISTLKKIKKQIETLKIKDDKD
jgi:hypothetical protein